MIVCPNCGTANEGAVCTNCGMSLVVYAEPVKTSKKSLIPWIIVLSVLVISLAGLIVYLALIKQDGGKAPENTEPVVLSGIEENYPKFSSGISVIDGKAFFYDENGIICYEGPERKIIYPSNTWNFVTDGKSVITSSDNNSVIRVDVETSSIETLFRVEAYSTAIIGATADRIFIGTQASENEWFGYTISAYDYDGNKLKGYGDYLDGYMENGILILYNYRTDVSATAYQVIDPTDDTVLYKTKSDMLSWGVHYSNGKIYTIEVPENMYEADYSVKFSRIDPDGTVTTLRTFDVKKGTYNYSFYFESLGPNAVATIYNFDNGAARYFNLETNEELVTPFDSEIRLDSEGIPYCVVDNDVYRQSADGTYNFSTSISGWDAYVYFIVGDYIYYTSDSLVGYAYGPIK